MAFADTARLVASLELQDKFTRPLSAAESQLAKTERRMSTLESVSYRTGRGLRSAVDNIRGFATSPLVLASVTAGVIGIVKAGSDLQESLNKVKVVLGGASDEVIAFSETTADSLGLSQQAALDAAGAFGNMLTVVGLTDEQAADFSIDLVKLAADMASFNNQDPSEMLEKLRSGLAGEAEPLRRFGVFLSEAAVKAEAYRVGIAKTGEELTEAEKVQARYSLIMKQTADQQGDFARTSDSLANVQRRLRASITDSAAIIGTALLPALEDVAKEINTFLTENKDAVRDFAKGLPEAFDQLREAAGNIPWEAIGASLQLAGQASKTLLSAFTSMPDWVQTAVLTGWGLNKLTGGAITGIFGDLAKLAFGGIRGSTPATPVFTKEVGLGATGGALPVGGAGRIGSVLKGLAKLAGPLGLLVLAAEGFNLLADTVTDPTGEVRRRARESVITPPARFIGPTTVEAAQAIGGMPVKVVNRAEVFDEDAFREAKAGRVLQASQIAAIKTLEQRLIRDPNFRRQISSPEQFIRLLRRTSEFGRRGVGTAIEQGRTTGRDPTGQAFVALVKRLDAKTLKSNVVQGEIRRHIQAARSLIGTGNTQQDRKLQRTIDTLREILGETRTGNRKQDDAKRAIDNTSSKTQGILREVVGEQRATKTATERVANKDFSPRVTVNANTTVNTAVSVSDVIRSVTTTRFATSTKGTSLLGVI